MFLFKPIGHLLMMIWRSTLRQLDRAADDAVIIIQMSGSVGRVIYATNTILKDTSVKCMKLGCEVPAFALGPQCPHSQELFRNRSGLKKSHTTPDWIRNPRPSHPKSEALTTTLRRLM